MNGNEHGPWEDFAPPPTKEERGPWEDFAPQTDGLVGAEKPNVRPLSFWQTITTPLKEIPHPSFETVQKVLTFPAALARERLEMQPDEEKPSPILEKVAQAIPSEKATAIATGVIGAGADLGSFFTSPLGISTLGIGYLPKLAQRAVALGFAGQMASQTPELARELGTELANPEAERDYAKITNLAASGGLNTFLAGLGAAKGLAPSPKPTAIERTADATRTLIEQRGRQPEHPQVEEGALPTGPSRGDRPVGATPQPETPVAPRPSAPPDTGINALKPAVKLPSGDVVSEAPPATHAEILKDVGVPPKEIPHADPARGFVTKEDPQTLLSRKEAEQIAGVEGTAKAGGLDSQDLPPEQPIVGMGGAVPDEFQTAGTGQDIYGIAHRVRQERAASGQVVSVPRGKGISTPDSIETGREILAKNPKAADDAIDLFETTSNISADNMAAVRAKGEELAQVARNVEEKFGTDSKEYLAAYDALSKWDTRTKPMQTEWHRAGMAQQGETDIDTGTFTGLQKAYQSDTGKVFTPQQAVQAKKIVGQVKVARTEAITARDNLYKQLDMEMVGIDAPAPKNLDEARMLFAKYKSGEKFTPQQLKTLWSVAKSLYIDKGEVNFDDIRHWLATDFGLTADDIGRALAQKKNIKRLTDEAWKKQTDARNVQEQAKRWLKNTAMPGYLRAFASVPKAMFTLKVFGHGTVALGTHAPMYAFQPPKWKIYANNFVKMYRMVGKPAYYESQVQDLLRNPNYVTAKRAGLVNDPYQFEDYTDPKIAQWFGKRAGALSGMGNRGYAVLKMLRQDVFDKHWNSLSANGRTPEVAKALADSINHATGVVKTAAPRGAHIALFAPRLLMSRVAWLAVDPAKSVNTFARWRQATEAEKMFAINQAKEKAWVLGTSLSLLALNQALLEATDSKQKVNMTDVMRSDFMKFKGYGLQVSYGNPMLTLARLPLRLWVTTHREGGKLKNIVYPDETAATQIWRYMRTQMSPFASVVSDLFLGTDYQNRPLPFSDQPVPKRLRQEGIEQYTWPEYVSEIALPIPFAEAAREVWHDMNAGEADIDTLWKALATTAFMGGTGGRVQEDLNPFQQ